MSFYNKTGTTYIPSPEQPVGLLPTKNGFEQLVIVTKPRDMSWVAVNNKSKKGASK